MNTTHEYIDLFMKGYLEAMWFTECPEEFPSPPRPPMSEEMTVKVLRECGEFYIRSSALIQDRIEEAGRDFWYTRQGHGCGFWDGDWDLAAGELMSNRCKEYGEVWIEVGDDGFLYQTGGKK